MDEKIKKEVQAVPRLAQSDDEILACFPVMQELRTKLQREDFLGTVHAMQADGYRLAYLQVDGEVVSVAGYRIYQNLFMGKHLYVDDLVTAASQRSKGYGELMLKWLRAQATAQECRVFHLDSGTHRKEAHKFYFQQGLTIASFHFSESLIED